MRPHVGACSYPNPAFPRAVRQALGLVGVGWGSLCPDVFLHVFWPGRDAEGIPRGVSGRARVFPRLTDTGAVRAAHHGLPTNSAQWMRLCTTAVHLVGYSWEADLHCAWLLSTPNAFSGCPMSTSPGIEGEDVELVGNGTEDRPPGRGKRDGEIRGVLERLPVLGWAKAGERSLFEGNGAKKASSGSHGYCISNGVDRSRECRSSLEGVGKTPGGDPTGCGCRGFEILSAHGGNEREACGYALDGRSGGRTLRSSRGTRLSRGRPSLNGSMSCRPRARMELRYRS